MVANAMEKLKNTALSEGGYVSSHTVRSSSSGGAQKWKQYCPYKTAYSLYIVYPPRPLEDRFQFVD